MKVVVYWIWIEFDYLNCGGKCFVGYVICYLGDNVVYLMNFIYMYCVLKLYSFFWS